VSLYRKYRPNTLDEIVGNDDTKEVLQAMIETDEVPHSILFSGPHGCGKTTFGRIIANALNIRGHDFMELNTADYRGIDDIRSINQRLLYRAISGNRKMWLLDECHELTKPAQDAVLKALEDTPKHVHFILCTTDPQKLLPTIRSRCSQFQVECLTEKEMIILLLKIVKAEGDELTKEVYKQIYESSEGHPRDALTILEQVLKVSADKRLEMSKRVVNVELQTIELCRAIMQRKNWKVLAAILKELKQNDPEGIRRQIIGYLNAVLLNGKDDPNAANAMGWFIEPFYNTGFPGLTYACYNASKEASA